MSGKSPGPDLRGRIAAEILSTGPLPFSRFMELALYDREDGYYASGRAGVGKDGDFYTNVSVGPVFGEILAGQFLEMAAALGGGAFTIVEQGANDGRFAADVLDVLTARGAREICYAIVEPFAALEEKQRATLAGRPVTWFRSVDALPPFRGVHFSNELFDALPFDLAKSTGAGWIEQRVGLSEDGAFVWRDGGTVEKLPRRPAGTLAEIRHGEGDLLTSIAGRMECGFLLAIDYGGTRDEILAPHRTRGTFACFRAHRRDEDPLSDPGEKDITAHVDFTGLEEAGRAAGFEVAGICDQHHFLVGAASGLLHSLNGRTDPAAAKTLRTLRTLLHPETMGRQFKVIALRKKVAAPSALSGFQFARPRV